MKNERTMRSAALGLVLAGGLLLTAVAQGSETNPLVTLGYLTEKFLPQVEARVEEKAAQRDAGLEAKLQTRLDEYAAWLEESFREAAEGENGGTAASASFGEVSLTEGQTLTLSAGGELLLRSGEAVCKASSAPGLVDTTTGDVLEGGGALVLNHLYLSTANGRGLTASGAVTLLVRGEHQISET